MDSQYQIHLLLVEDDSNLSYLLVENLRAKGFEVTLARDGKTGAKALEESYFDLVILDVMLPGKDGFALANIIRTRQPATPFIFLTARTLEKDKLHGFESGADDYITKPFSFKELYYRIQAILRRLNKLAPAIETHTLKIGNAVLNPVQRVLTINGVEKKLSQRESGLLTILLQHNGKYVTRSEILKKVWGNDDYFTAKSMDVYLTRVRKLLKEDPTLEIENLYGTGYRIHCDKKIT